MNREITFRKVEAGRYVNTETGIEIIRVGRQVRSDGIRPAGWIVARRILSSRSVERVEVTYTTTLAAAKDEALPVALRTRAQIANAYHLATASYLNRIAINIQDNAEDDGWGTATPIIGSAHDALKRGEYARARAFINEAHAAAFPQSA